MKKPKILKVIEMIAEIIDELPPPDERHTSEMNITDLAHLVVLSQLKQQLSCAMHALNFADLLSEKESEIRKTIEEAENN